LPGIISYRSRFIDLLRQGGINRPNADILSRLQSLKHDIFMTCEIPFDATTWYLWAKSYPQTLTRGAFHRATGYQLGGMHPIYNNIFIAGDRHGRSFMYKLVPSEQASEVQFANELRGGPYLVCYSYETSESYDETGQGNSPTKLRGLLMRQYNRSLFGEAFQICQEVLFERCKAMILAVNYIHKKGIVHVDLKESNIFMMDGVWFIGDFGSCVKYGDPVKTFTPGMYLLSELVGTSAKWHYDWFMLAVIFAHQLNVKAEAIESQGDDYRTRIIEVFNIVTIPELKDLLLSMVNCEEPLMSFLDMDTFPIIEDSFS
jgi:hypothetical protein